MLLLVLADNLEVKHPPDGEPGMPLFSSLSLELSANHNFNASVEPDQAMASFQRRWIEIPEENLSQYSSKSLADTYREATGISLRDQAAAMLVLYANCVHGIDVANFNVTFSGMGWDANRARSALKYVTLSSSDYRTVVRRELAEHGLDWYFTAFSRYPLVEFGDDVVLLDPSLLLKRCAGYLPFYDVAEALSKAKRKAELEEFRRAFNDYSERLVVEAFTSMVGGSNGRVFGESDLKRAFPGAKNADFVVDYGDAWVVVEVTTSQVSRDTVNGASLRGLERDRDMVVDEAKQVAATIESLRRNPAKLLGPQEVRRRYYPVVVITEGFPNNPIMQTLIRDHLKGEGYLQGPDIAPLELLSLTDIDMVEGAMENSGVSFTEILRLKSASNFWADSVRNFVLSDTRFDVRRPARIARALDRFFTEVGHEFGQTFDFGDVDDG